MNLTALILVCLGIIGFFSVVALSNRLTREAMREEAKWSSTYGRVTFSESTVKEGNSAGETGVAINNVATWIRFSYTVKDITYSAEQQWTDSGLSGKGRPLAGKYPNGSQVIVRYNADNPSEAKVEQAISLAEGDGCLNNLLGAGLAASGGMFIIGIVLFFIKC